MVGGLSSVAYRSMKVSPFSSGSASSMPRLRCLEGLVDLAVGQQQAADRAVAGQLGPAGRLVDVGANGRRLAAAAGGGLDQLERDGHLVGGAHDDLVDHHDGHGGAGHGIDGHCVAVAGMPDHHALVGLHALILGGEVVQLLLGNADQQDRLVVLEHVGILDRALRIEQHLEVDRLAGVGRDVDDVDRLEGVARISSPLRRVRTWYSPSGSETSACGKTCSMRWRSTSYSRAWRPKLHIISARRTTRPFPHARRAPRAEKRWAFMLLPTALRDVPRMVGEGLSFPP